MSESEDFEGPATGRALPKSSAAVFIDDSDRAFLYRAVAVHASAGVVPAVALAAIAEALADIHPDEAGSSASLPRRIEGANRLRSGIETVSAGSGDVADRVIQEAGFRLGPLERACIRLPASAFSDAAASASLFSALAELFQTERRR